MSAWEHGSVSARAREGASIQRGRSVYNLIVDGMAAKAKELIAKAQWDKNLTGSTGLTG